MKTLAIPSVEIRSISTTVDHGLKLVMFLPELESAEMENLFSAMKQGIVELVTIHFNDNSPIMEA
jgi:hypothetical protein